MAKIIEIRILTDLAAGKELRNDCVLGESFAKLLDRRMVAFDGREPTIMPAGRAYLAEAQARAARARKARNASARARSDAMRSVGMTRTRYGWE